jgi:glycosyltransferase 2 family protein
VFWFVYRNLDIDQIGNALKELNYGWIFLSFIFGLSSSFVRAVRWKMLIAPMGYQPRKRNLFLSVLVLYFTNLIIPRGGEIARCGVITKYEKIPFTKLIGTVFVERLTELIAFFMIFFVILLWQFPYIEHLMVASDLTMDFSGLKTKLIITVIGVTVIVAVYFLLSKLGFFNAIRTKIQKIKHDFIEGIRSVIHLKEKWLFIFYTFLIYLLWLLMLYVVFFAYPPTEKLSFSVAIFTYAVGTFAYLLPIQAGIGVWHLIVIQCLFLFGIDKESGMIFALIAHTFTNVIYLLLGAIGLALLPIVNNNDEGIE